MRVRSQNERVPRYLVDPAIPIEKHHTAVTKCHKAGIDPFA